MPKPVNLGLFTNSSLLIMKILYDYSWDKTFRIVIKKIKFQA